MGRSLEPRQQHRRILKISSLSLGAPKVPQRCTFSDGGFGQTNNPTQEGVLEIESLHGKHYVGVVVSVGTARGSKEPRGKSILRRVKQLAETATDPENVERNIGGKLIPMVIFTTSGSTTQKD